MSESGNRTTLQKHVAFWDKDGDGIISFLDLYTGFRELGFRVPTAFFNAFCICILFSYPSQASWYPDWAFRIRVDGIHRAKHGSDTGVFTRRGEFNPMNFDDIFADYADPPDHDSLTLSQIIRLVTCNTDRLDPFGWVASFFHWIGLYILIGPEDGRIKREDVSALYNGTLFERIAQQVRRRREARVRERT